MVYYYDGQRIIETRDGSGNLVQQFIHGTQYIDVLVMVRVKDKGDMYVQQDANWNVIGLTDQGGSLVERHVYRPYGELTIHQETSFGDRDGDGDVDSTDKGTVGTTCTGTVSGACRILDLDFDGDYDSADATKFDSLAQGNARHPGRLFTSVDQPFGHQGLLFDAEIGSYQNRARQYDPGKRRFAQRDPLVFGIGVKASYQDGMNVYGYLKVSPFHFFDPMGRDCCATNSPNDQWDDYPLPYELGWVCCDCFVAYPFCMMRTCLDPVFASQQNAIKVKCVREHEEDHARRYTCTLTNSGCRLTSVGTYTNNQDECWAYRAEAECLRRETRDLSPTPELDENCDWVGCMIDRICQHGQNPNPEYPGDTQNAYTWCKDNGTSLGGCKGL